MGRDYRRRKSLFAVDPMPVSFRLSWTVKAGRSLTVLRERILASSGSTACKQGHDVQAMRRGSHRPIGSNSWLSIIPARALDSEA
jgi:hypothetical protein